jgi:hypothetical protein
MSGKMVPDEIRQTASTDTSCPNKLIFFYDFKFFSFITFSYSYNNEISSHQHNKHFFFNHFLSPSLIQIKLWDINSLSFLQGFFLFLFISFSFSFLHHIKNTFLFTFNFFFSFILYQFINNHLPQINFFHHHFNLKLNSDPHQILNLKYQILHIISFPSSFNSLSPDNSFPSFLLQKIIISRSLHISNHHLKQHEGIIRKRMKRKE